MLKPYKIADYISEYKPEWACTMPDGCPPEDVLVAEAHPFFRLAKKADVYTADDFKSYAETDPQRQWGQMLPLAVGLKLPMCRRYQGIIALTLQPADGVEKQTGTHRSHYTWWRTRAFQMSNLNMLAL